MFIKEMNAAGVRLYFTPNCPMIIPTKLWGETRDAKGYVFSKLPVTQYLTAMNKVAAECDNNPRKLIMSKTNVYTSSTINHGSQYTIKVEETMR